MSYIYIESERWTDEKCFTHVLYTVGHYDDGQFIPESDHSNKEDAAARAAYLNGSGFNLAGFIQDQNSFSQRTFGPGNRTAGVIKHIRKELREVAKQPDDVSEWCDIILLAIDGALRRGFSAQEIITGLVAKLKKNESRSWPDWRTAPTDQPIEHIRSDEVEQ